MKATKTIVMKKRTRIQGLQTISGNSYVKYNNSSQSLKKGDSKLRKNTYTPRKAIFAQTALSSGFKSNFRGLVTTIT